MVHWLWRKQWGRCSPIKAAALVLISSRSQPTSVGVECLRKAQVAGTETDDMDSAGVMKGDRAKSKVAEVCALLISYSAPEFPKFSCFLPTASRSAKDWTGPEHCFLYKNGSWGRMRATCTRGKTRYDIKRQNHLWRKVQGVHLNYCKQYYKGEKRRVTAILWLHKLYIGANVWGWIWTRSFIHLKNKLWLKKDKN